jgi:hypothetical protein
MRTPVIAIWASAVLCLFGAVAADAQCSALSNMQSIAAGNNGMVIEEWFEDEEIQFYIYFSGWEQAYVFVVDASYGMYYELTEDANGGVAAEFYDNLCEVRGTDAPTGGVIVTLTRPTDTGDYDIREFSVTSAGVSTVVSQAYDWCPCSGTGIRMRAQCTPFACRNNLVCKKMGNKLTGTPSGWCTESQE